MNLHKLIQTELAKKLPNIEAKSRFVSTIRVTTLDGLEILSPNSLLLSFKEPSSQLDLLVIVPLNQSPISIFKKDVQSLTVKVGNKVVQSI